MLKKEEVIKYYKSYGFSEEVSSDDNILIFTIQSGHFYNAEIVILKDNIPDEVVKKEFDGLVNAGFACQKKIYENITDVESALFNGFFSVKHAKNKLKKSYRDHIDAINKSMPMNSKYEYIRSKYFVNGREGSVGLISEIKKKLMERKPILFLIEAAAGFGKTCTAYELLNSILNDGDDKILPFFTELSKNRQAKIFKYVLLDEINRNFYNLKYDLVIGKIKEGKVPVILDGFDELIDERKENDIKNIEISEPMLGTISSLLENNSKIILTTRRTAIFDSLQFNEWIDENASKFEICRIKISEPTIREWLPANKVDFLIRENETLLKLKNPVLLSYLKTIDMTEFEEVVKQPKIIVEKYLSTMLERERVRQSLKMDVDQQKLILEEIAKYLVDKCQVSIKKQTLIEFLNDSFFEELEIVRDKYPDIEKPTIDALVNKLANHALLDGFENNENKNITFVNEFILGYFISKNILKDSEWCAEKYFIEPAVLASISLDDADKKNLWSNLQLALEIINDDSVKLISDIALNDKITINLNNSYVQDILFEGIDIGNMTISLFGFSECIFKDCNFNFNNMSKVTFNDCKFYNCKIFGVLNNIYELGCESSSDDEVLVSIKDQLEPTKVEMSERDNFNEIDKFILEKFWPTGRASAHLHRHKNTFFKTNKYTYSEVNESFEKLNNLQILKVPNKEDFSALNYEYIGLIKDILGRN
ncbi:NACHT domain-containing protein [Acinetobacter vivianii]|uniref:NACHT domain-containing protein n=1 Tax=Acinetobacter vivianii TaxID=1776742 RepID=UPI002DBE2FA5|nr:hypothetical protein [Acinetobacter vivianii]MEB6478264.1 hypothetical protein [Acinetobacter vivianii]MEB6657905.1 hypothetical protein [Acinetobacter vivianii]